MARKQGFRLVEVVNLLTEVTGMLSTAIRKAGGEPIDQNQFFTDLQDLVKRYGNAQIPTALSTTAQVDSNIDADYNLAADILAGAVLSQQIGKDQEAWESFQTACKSSGIEQLLAAFEAYNSSALAEEGVDPTVTDNDLTEEGNHPDSLPLDDDEEEEDEAAESQVSNVEQFMHRRQSRLKPTAETIALANKISQSGSKKAIRIVKRNFVK